MRENQTIENSLLTVIGNSGGQDLIQEAAELTLDQFCVEGILKDVPIVSTVVNLYKTAIGVQGYIFTKKMQKFLFSLSKIPFEDRMAFKTRLDSDARFRDRVTENLILLIDRLDNMDKPELLAKAFSAFIANQIDFITFYRLAVAVDRCILDDLKSLRGITNRVNIEPHIAQVLSSAGLVEVEVIPQVRGEGIRNLYQITELGKVFVKVLL